MLSNPTRIALPCMNSSLQHEQNTLPGFPEQITYTVILLTVKVDAENPLWIFGLISNSPFFLFFTIVCFLRSTNRSKTNGAYQHATPFPTPSHLFTGKWHDCFCTRQNDGFRRTLIGPSAISMSGHNRRLLHAEKMITCC